MTDKQLQSLFQVRKLEQGEQIKSFDCGDADLNDFILRESSLYRTALLAVTYVLESKETGETIAYFSLANDRVSLTDFASKAEFNRFRKHRFPNEKRIRSYPAAKLCRLAVSLNARELHIGTHLINFIKAYFLEDNKTGCRFVTVDAYLAAVPFYKKNGFVQLNDNDDNEHTRLLYFDLSDYQDALSH